MSLGISLDGMVVHARVTCSIKGLHLGREGHYSDPCSELKPGPLNLESSTPVTIRSMHLPIPSTDSAVAKYSCCFMLQKWD